MYHKHFTEMNYDDVCAKYITYYNNNSIQQQDVIVSIEQIDEDETKNESLHQPPRSSKQQNDKKDKIKNAKNIGTSIFESLQSFDSLFDDTPESIIISNVRQMYAVDYMYMLEKCMQNNSSKYLTYNYPGGYVLPLKKGERIFSSVKDSTNSLFTYICGVCDFNSLYPTEIIKENICITSVCYNSAYMIDVNGKLYSPFDTDVFDVCCVPLKLNSTFLNVLAFVTKPDLYVSATLQLVTTLNSLRTACKLEMSEMKRLGKKEMYTFFNFQQLAVKVVTNSMYGILKSSFRPVFRPVLASLITKSARQSLLRFYLHFLDYFRGLRIPVESRRIMYGDTDSAFLIASHQECHDILSSFSTKYICNRNVLKLDLERVASCGLFLAKKSYILNCLSIENGTLSSSSGDDELYVKQIFTKMKSFPSKTFLSQFIKLVITDVLHTVDINWSTLYEKLESMYAQFNACHDREFVNSFTMSQDLQDYKSKTQYISQLKHLKQITDKQFLRGTKIFYSHYNFIFRECEFYGPINTAANNSSNNSKNNQLVKFLSRKSNNACTIMVDELKPYFCELFSVLKISIYRQRILDIDTSSIVNNILTGLETNTREKLYEQMLRARGVVFGGTTFDNKPNYNDDDDVDADDDDNNTDDNDSGEDDEHERIKNSISTLKRKFNHKKIDLIDSYFKKTSK